MSRWSDLLENHAIHATLEWLRESVTKEFDDLDEDEVAEKRRLIKIISLFEQALSEIDPEIIPFNQLDSLNSGLRNNNIATQINAYSTNGNVSALVAASDLLTNQLTILSLLVSLTDKVNKEKQIEELERLIDTSTKTLINKKDQLTEELSSLSTSANEKETRLNDLSSAIEQKQTEVNSLISEWQNQFSSAQESRSQEFSKWRDSFSSEKNSDINTVISKYSGQLDENVDDFQSRVTEILTDGEAKHQAILELYEITAGDSVGAGYLQNANLEKKQADNWRLVSVGFIAATVFWLFFAYFSNKSTSNDFVLNNVHSVAAEQSKSPNDKTPNKPEKKISITKQSSEKHAEFDWYQLFVTISLSGVLLWGSAYSAQQSTKHRNNEKRTRWFALEVKAIDPFISSLDPDQQKELKKQLSERIFGQSHNNVSEDTKVIDEHVFSTVADTLGKILSKIPK